ncbi:MAG: anthranilate phosphoribosyltransferase [Pseudomonadota bacterium]
MTEATREWLETLLDGRSLSEEHSAELMRALTDTELAPARAGALLAALRAKGEQAEEIRGFARAMRGLALSPALPADFECIDIVGTGGDGSGTYNLSTGAALLTAACGLPVAKHGNRSVSSRSGSADVLEALGLTLPLPPQESARCLRETGFTFFFAPAFHPAMKAIAPIRAAMGVRTVFNLLGPLTNPAAPPYNVIGAFSKDAARLMAESLAGLPAQRSFVVHGEPGWDEATPAGDFLLLDVNDGTVTESVRTPEDYGLGRCEPDALRGGDAVENAAALQRVLAGRDYGPHRDALLMATSLALEVAGRVSAPREGVTRAESAIDNGDAARTLARIVEFQPATE